MKECTIEFARQMVKNGNLRGLVDCPIHGHHNPYHMYKTGEDMKEHKDKDHEFDPDENGNCYKCGMEQFKESNEKREWAGKIEFMLENFYNSGKDKDLAAKTLIAYITSLLAEEREKNYKECLVIKEETKASILHEISAMVISLGSTLDTEYMKGKLPITDLQMVKGYNSALSDIKEKINKLV